MENVIEGNKLIAEFMGGRVTAIGTCKPYPSDLPHWAKQLQDFDWIKIGGYEYHSSWDWLRPVIEKIFEQSLAYPTEANKVCDMKIVVGIKYAWPKVVEFIKFYNTKTQ